MTACAISSWWPSHSHGSDRSSQIRSRQPGPVVVAQVQQSLGGPDQQRVAHFREPRDCPSDEEETMAAAASRFAVYQGKTDRELPIIRLTSRSG
jgi:hypothetical protein